MSTRPSGKSQGICTESARLACLDEGCRTAPVGAAGSVGSSDAHEDELAARLVTAPLMTSPVSKRICVARAGDATSKTLLA